MFRKNIVNMSNTSSLSLRLHRYKTLLSSEKHFYKVISKRAQLEHNFHPGTLLKLPYNIKFCKFNDYEKYFLVVNNRVNAQKP